MIGDLIDTFNHYVEPGSWLRTITTGVGATTSLLFSFKFYLNTKRVKCSNNVRLDGKICVITGSNTGIGKAVALEFARRGARVVLACRDAEKARLAAEEIRRKIKDADVDVYQLDLASLASVRSCADAIRTKEPGVDVLVNNAGIMSCPFQRSKEGIEMQFAVNHLGHFLFTNLLLDSMKGRGDARVITVSSSLYKRAHIDFINYNHQDHYQPGPAYGRSKLANLLFTRELARRLQPSEGITVNSMHPGVVWTELGRYRLKNFFLKLLFMIPAYFLLRSPAQGAETIVHMATEPELCGVSGKYFGDCAIESVQENAEDDGAAEKLWELSEILTGFRWSSSTN